MRRAKPPTAERLRELLDYDSATGVFRWKISTSNRVRVGEIAGHLRRDGYHCISIDGTVYLAHLLAWLHHYGAWPKRIVDHKDTVRNHNWILNLRLATHSQNNVNCANHGHNTSGYRGVSFHKPIGKWQAYIGVNHRNVHLGFFDTPQEAWQARRAAEPKYFGQFAPTTHAPNPYREHGEPLAALGRAARAAGLTIADIEEIARSRRGAA
jgi:hypothetical protein